MTRALVALGLVASVVALAGCAAAPPLPEPLTQEEVKQRLAESQAEWWNSMFPDEPQPVVDVVAYLSPDSASNQINQCVRDSEIEGVTFRGDGGIAATGPAASDALNRQFFICNLQFPQDPSQVQMLSADESEWLYDFNSTRLMPCLRLQGYTVLDRSGRFAPEDRGYWTPYYDIEPIPTDAEWQRIDRVCPPAPIGPDYSDYRPSRG